MARVMTLVIEVSENHEEIPAWIFDSIADGSEVDGIKVTGVYNGDLITEYYELKDESDESN